MKGSQAKPKARGAARLWNLSPARFDRLPKDAQALAQSAASWDANNLRKSYERTRNGAHAWRAFRALRNTRQQIPGWIMAFLDACAKALAGTAAPFEVARAIGMLHPTGGDSHGETHADLQLRDQQDLLTRYDAEVARIGSGNPNSPASKAEVCRRLAAEGFGASGRAVEQKIRRLHR